MAKTTMRLVKKPRRPEDQHREIRKEVVKALQAVGKAHASERMEITREFETEIDFDYTVRVTPKELRVLVFVSNSGDRVQNSTWTVGDLWRALDKTGTRAHRIYAKRAKALRFQWGGPGSYVPKTKRGGRNPGGGYVRGGETTYRQSVQHPGMQPRKFTERINRDLRPFLDKQIERGYANGFRRAERLNK